MATVTLEGVVPVYVVVDIDKGKVKEVVAIDEDFYWVGWRAESVGVTAIHSLADGDLPVAVDESGTTMKRTDERIKAALDIADGTLWPEWTRGW